MLTGCPSGIEISPGLLRFPDQAENEGLGIGRGSRALLGLGAERLFGRVFRVSRSAALTNPLLSRAGCLLQRLAYVTKQVTLAILVHSARRR